MEHVTTQSDLANTLAAAAHPIHGSSEGRFSVTYCPGKLNRAEIESVNFRWGDMKDLLLRYDRTRLAEDWNVTADGEDVFYVSNPALGLWAHRERFALSA